MHEGVTDYIRDTLNEMQPYWHIIEQIDNTWVCWNSIIGTRMRMVNCPTDGVCIMIARSSHDGRRLHNNLRSYKLDITNHNKLKAELKHFMEW
jgi:hypothetical protein